MVVADPGDWFDETLSSIRDLDYDPLQVVVIDAGDGDPDELERWVHTTLPEARVVDAGEVTGFAQAANRLLDGSVRSPYIVVCHDDVAFAPDTIEILVGESERSDAAIVGPKLVHWDRPEVLQHVGLGADKFAVTAALAEEDELDQQQHDGVADVFVVPSAVLLVRTEVFELLEGFDPGIDHRGEDLDLCWRTLLAGERVLVAPDAVVRHREALNDRRGVDDTRRLRARHQLRAVLSNYSVLHLLRVLPQLVLITSAEAFAALVTGRLGQLGDLFAAWRWNLRRLGSIRARRRLLRRTRVLPDRELRRFQEPGSARLNAFVRGQIGRGDAGLVGAGRGIASTLRSGPIRTAALVGALAAAVLIFGSRSLVTGPIPAVGELYPFPGGAGDLLGSWLSGWSDVGVGFERSSPIGVGLLGVASLVTFGSTELLRTILLLGMVPLGAVGAWRLLRPTGSRRARVVAVVLYLACPVPYNAFAAASWSGLIAYGASPWIVARLCRVTEAAPYGERGGGRGPGIVRRPLAVHALALGALLAVVAAFVPFALALAVVVGFGLFVGSLVAGRAHGLGRLAVAVVGGVVVGAVLHLPGLLSLFDGSSPWDLVAGSRSTEPGSLGYLAILRFETGPLGVAPLGWAFLAPAGLVLVVGRGWRLAWGIRAWFLALAGWGLVWAGEAGALPVALPRPEVVLAPAAVGMALAAGLSMVAFEVDVRRHRFGWRQLVPVTAAVGLVVATLPVVGASFEGDWQVPDRDFDETLGFLARPGEEGSYRILWIGHPDALPLPGWPLGDDVSFAVSTDGVPDVRSHWIAPLDGPTRRLRDDLRSAVSGNTSRLGDQLAELGIRYVLLPQQVAPDPFARIELPSPDRVLSALSGQLDLQRRAGVNAGIVVYENRSAEMTTTRLALTRAEFEAGAFGLALGDLGGRAALIDEIDVDEQRGPLPDDSVLHASIDPSTRWRLEIDGRRVPAEPYGDGTSVFVVDEGGDATLRYDTRLLQRLGVVAQLVAWVLVAALLIRQRRRGSVR